MKIDLVFLIVLGIVIAYIFILYKVEGMADIPTGTPLTQLTIDQLTDAIYKTYLIDVAAIKNLSDVATKLQAGGLVVPGNLGVNGKLATNNFDPTKSKNPFAYFTQIIYYAFLRRIQKEKKQTYVKYKATEQMGILDEMELMEFEDGTSKQFELYDNIAEFIENYEEAKQAKKDSKTVKKPKGIEKFME